ncbi:hypothetical protein ACFWAF_20505 [Streptomyces microflavus]|uniref:hypothetical protein n=1 Tax=Streptomyces microflavus TaxID=1919 RepID=UPI00364AF2BB
MVSIVLVHGTGVREPSYNRLVAQVTANLRELVPQLRILPCLWGDLHGAKLNARGASLPPEALPETSAAEPVPESAEVSDWAALEADPFVELRLLAEFPLSRHYSPVPQTAIARARAEVGAMDGTLFAEQLSKHGLAPADMDRAKDIALEGLGCCFPKEAPVDRDELRRALARLMAVSIIGQADARWDVIGAAVDGKTLDALVEAILDSWGAPRGELGIGTKVTKRLTLPLTRGFEYGASQFLRGRRLQHTEHGAPMIGDILRYQVRGEGVREAVAEAVDGADGPVVVLAHSLGGVACVDLLASCNLKDKVTALVTVGSQAPFFYELDALWSLPYGKGLPQTFPTWWNVYDPRDPLAYVGKGVFGGDRVTDVEFDTRRPLLRAHSAYWDHKPFYSWLAEKVLR